MQLRNDFSWGSTCMFACVYIWRLYAKLHIVNLDHTYYAGFLFQLLTIGVKLWRVFIKMGNEEMGDHIYMYHNTLQSHQPVTNASKRWHWAFKGCLQLIRRSWNTLSVFEAGTPLNLSKSSLLSLWNAAYGTECDPLYIHFPKSSFLMSSGCFKLSKSTINVDDWQTLLGFEWHIFFLLRRGLSKIFKICSPE